MSEAIVKCVCQHCRRVTVVPQETMCLAAEDMQDKIEGLQADLDSAIEVAFNRGATEWVRLNYPDHFNRLSAA